MDLQFNEGDMITMKEMMRIKYKNYDLSLPAQDLDGLCKLMGKYFPEEEGNIRRICELALKMN